MKKYNWEVDVPVYMIFFNRPEPLKKVFESVKKARPSKLFLRVTARELAGVMI